MKKRFWLLLIGIIMIVGLVFVRVYPPADTGTDTSVETNDEESGEINALLATYGLQETVDSKNVLLVGEGRSYKSVQAAVEKAADGSVIVVFPGKYTQPVRASNKTLYIIGVDRTECVITHPNGNYFFPPIEMGSGMLANLTVYATAQELAKNAIAKAYAIHIDYDSSTNAMLDIVDVDFLNDDYQVAGIGLREGFTLRFRNCLFECKADQNAFFCHDDATREGSVRQRLIVENCRFINNGATRSTILMQSAEAKGSEILCQWSDNTVENRENGDLFSVSYWKPKVPAVVGWQEMSFWKNSEDSGGNTLHVLNEQS